MLPGGSAVEFDYQAEHDEVEQGLSFLTASARRSVEAYRGLFDVTLRGSVLRVADDLAMRRACLGPCQPIDRHRLARFNLTGSDYWCKVYSCTIAEEVARNELYCSNPVNRQIESIMLTGGQYDSNEFLIPESQTQQTIREPPDRTHARLNQNYMTSCIATWISEQLEAASSGIVKGWITSAYHQEFRLKGISSIAEDLDGIGLQFGDHSWVGTILIPAGLPAWVAQRRDEELVASLLCLCPVNLEPISQLVMASFEGFDDYAFFTDEYEPISLGVKHSSGDTNTPIYLMRGLAERSSVRLAITSPGGNICRRHSMIGRVFCDWVAFFGRPLPRSVSRRVFTAWIRVQTYEDFWKASLGAAVDVYIVQRLLRHEDVNAHEELLKAKKTAMRKKFFTLGIAGGDLKRNSQARRDLLSAREGRRLHVTGMAIIGDTAHSAQDLEARDGRWLAGMVEAPLWLADETATRRGRMSAMNQMWRGSTGGRVTGDVYCHMISASDDGPAADQV